ncbi:tetratricopeptide repeat protein [Kibdelosporangium philippinense]|uniref:Tetratricopeptide repeat protein n=1 Tax=Kibdelosporangium philippinense TaxID=211113 RepID=A0ABS8ZFH1_9PSEU|nr:helix-turn-helix domain-containing protein [Kibdelosporangium philippinense]MCE7006272.1 tetratricopeptide repeat protein [Kibdelosporangium philippinense]
MSAFGERLRQARQAAGWSLRELSARVHYNTGYLSKIENGLRPASIELAKRCDAELGTTLVQLIPPLIPRSTQRPAPRQLPAHAPRIVDRAQDIEILDKMLDSDRMTIAVLSGTAGVGKSTLALHWAHRIQERFPDGQLYAAMRGFGAQPPLETSRVLRGFLQDLGVAPQGIPAEEDERAAMFRSLLADKQVLVVLDNVRDSDHVQSLLPGSPACAVVITSRDRLDRLVALEGAQRRTLELFDVRTSRELLAMRLGEDAVTAEPQAATELATLSAGLPLALSIVASRVNTGFETPLQSLVAELTEARLDGLDLGESLDLRTVFSWSCERLSATAARMFRLLGVFPGPDISTHCAAALAGTGIGQARRDLTELVRAHLLTEIRPGRFGFHDLLREYATEQAAKEESTRDAVGRVLDYYLHTALSGDKQLYNNHAGLAIDPPVEGAYPQELTDYSNTLRWFDDEHHSLMACVQLAADEGWDRHAWQLPRVLAGFLRLRGHWQDWANTQRLALRTAERIHNTTAQADAHRLLAQAHHNMCEYAETEHHAEHAIDLYGQLGDRTGEALAHRHLAWAYHEKTDYERAMAHHRQALALFRWNDHRLGEASSLNGLGWTTAHLGDHQAALGLCEEALRIADQLRDKHMRAAVLDSLGYIHYRIGSLGRAAEHYRQAIAGFRELGSSYFEALSLNNLGDVQAERDQIGAAESWLAAKAILDYLRHPKAAEVAAKLS